MWNHKKSLLLSRAVTALAGLTVAGMLAAGPWLVNWLIYYSQHAEESQYGLFMATLYAGGAIALAMLGCLFLVLRNLARREVFCQKNITLLRWLSWCCFAGAGIGGASGVYYLPWLLLGVAAGFVGLIVRVVKNMLAEAVALKEENDLTV